MKTPAMNYKFLLLILVLSAFAQGIGYGQESVPLVNESGTDATLSALTVSPVDIVGFNSNLTKYHVGVANTVTQVTITATAADAGTTIEIGKSETDKNTIASGSAQVFLLDEGRNTMYVWVTSQSGTIKKIYTIIVGRSVDSEYGWKAVEDFNTLRAAGNRSIDGIWSDGTTMWVADDWDEKIYAYNMPSNGGATAGVTDFDGDGIVGIPDFLLFAAQFGLSHGDVGYDARYDLDGDGTIGIGDFLIFVDAFGKEGG
ncbi:MAG: cadherin-like beta sandwich domain-containing protein [Gemmatimonadota bacterium]|nr:cadherin-like beta sandwich domain-containing protein [Gemmatimonadota bacterium]